MRKTKTDQMGQGFSFIWTGKKYGRVLLPGILRWYVKSFEMKGEDVIFPRLRNSGKGKGVVPVRDTSVSHGTARCQLLKEVRVLGLSKLTLNSARIGAATRGLRLGRAGRTLRPAGAVSLMQWTCTSS